MLETLLSFVLATVILSLSPGPDNIFVLTQSIVNGKKFGLATVFGLISGCLVHTTLLAFGVSAIIKQSENLFFTIKLFGAIYLLYLAFKVYQSDASIILVKGNVENKTTAQLFKQGFIMNVLNPKVSIFFLAFFPGFLFSDSISTVIQFYILGLIFMLVSLIIFSTIAILASVIAEKIKENKNIALYLKWTQIVVFVLIAVFILV
ncbi:MULTISPECIES: LysE family translocator [unclassified Polaribacter]|jgi:threonine/homoserine/homoserine lactone efflux protein|uniref:LysE family translocator n=1 Tax=unclassified Polaribacter TaxID=196858 RepID=UPI00052B9078|nr:MULTISPECIES: LysE family translocator [unclassified Polaribacter]KGL61114.1 lysine exporter protein LysE/YggA [Polaribacter sp. Hel1_33_49]MDG1194915.1 LysE family translocator [Polaribacter sp.]PKV64603.1 threonine/homoserine/homoserine lactone efflux protein [Polaribacter sp. Hel1_33_96]